MSDLRAKIEHLLSVASGTAGATTTDALKRATTELHALYKSQSAASIPALAEIALSHQQAEVRQLAAVECRKRLKPKAWSKVPQQTRSQIKSRLLHQLDASLETSEKVGHSLAHVIATIAEIEIPHSTWPEVLPWLWNAASSNSMEQRRNGVYCLSTVLASFVESGNGKAFSAHSAQLYPLFERTIADPDSLDIRLSTIKALGTMSDFTEATDTADVAALQHLIPSILKVLESCVATENEEAVTTCIDVLESMAISEAPLINDHIPSICGYCLVAAANENADEDIRSNLLNMVHFVVRYKKERIKALNLSKQLLENLLPIAALDDPEDLDADSPSKAAIRLVDALASSLPPSHVVDPLIALCQQFSGSSDPRMRKAAVAAFGSIFEGCSIYLQPHLDNLWPFVEKSLTDEDVRVRKAACWALSCMCESLGEDCSKRHAQLLPIIVNLIQYPETQRAALNSLDELLEYLGKGVIDPYLPALMGQLLALLPNVGRAEQGSVVGAIGSAAHAGKAAFRPFFQSTMDAILPFLQLTAANDGEPAEMLRGTVQDTLGVLAEAVGREAYDPYFQTTMQSAHQGASIESASLRECSYIFFAIIARVYKADFAPFLATVVPMLIASVIREDTAVDLADVNGIVNGFAPTKDDEDDGYIDDGNEDIEEIDIEAQSALAIEKEVACDALGELFQHCGEPYVPFLPGAVGHLIGALDHYYEGLRKAAASTLLSYIATGNDLTHPPPWKPGMSTPPLNHQIEQLADLIMPRVMKLFEEDDEQEVVQALLDDLNEVVTKVGPSLVVPYLDRICHATLLVLQRKHPCQTIEEGAQDEDDKELAEWDAMLVRAAADLVSTLAAAIGPAFSPAFATFLPALAGYYDSKSASSERSGMIGALAECCKGLEDGVSSYTDSLMQLFAQALADPELDVRSNAAYAAGLLVFHSNVDLTSYYGNIWSAVQSLFLRGDSHVASSLEARHASDNAAGCIARLILKNLGALDLGLILPVYLESLPVKEDYRENGVVCESLCLLLRTQTLAETLPILQILSVLSQSLRTHRDAAELDPAVPGLDQKTVQLIGQTIRSSIPESQAQSSGLLSLV